MPKSVITLTPFYKSLIEIWIELKTCLCTKHADNFCNIRQQIIWGNMRIKHKGKSLLFRNWIQSGITCLNDILSENGRISVHVIFNKLQNKQNWIAEFNILKNSLPKTRIQIIRSDNSVRTQVKIDHSQFYDVFSNLSNKQMYEYFVKRKFDIPYIHEYWSRFFNRQIHWEHVYFSFIKHC